MFEYSLIIVAAFFAGILNAIAGGGSFLTFPALVYIGIPVVSANATSAVAVFPGYLSSSIGFLEEIRAFDRKQLIQMILVTCVGGVAGALLLLITPGELFRGLAPWLLLLATVLFAAGDRISIWMSRGGKDGDEQSRSHSLAVLLVSTYGGYFNGGLGIILLALFSAMGFRDLNLMNGLKNALSFLLSSVSVLTFSIAGIVHWPQALVMMVAATVGGFGGARLARILPRKAIKVIIVTVGTLMTLAFFIF